MEGLRNHGKRALAIAAGIAVLGLMLLHAGTAGDACREALEMCGRLLIPSLFPFFVLSGYLNRVGLPGLLGRLLAPFAVKLFGVSGSGASAFVMGLMGGYPAGAAYIADMERSGSVTAREAERLLAFCSNSGPAFIVGAVGLGVFGSVRYGLVLYGIHIFAAFLTGLVFRGKHPCEEIQDVQLDTADPALALVGAVRQAAASILSVCGFAVCFSVLLRVLDANGALSMTCSGLAARFDFDPHFVRAMLTGLLELGSATAAMQGLRPCAASFALAAFLLGWGGLSVQFQTLAVLADSKIKGALHLTGRLLSAIFAAVTAYVAGIWIF